MCARCHLELAGLISADRPVGKLEVAQSGNRLSIIRTGESRKVLSAVTTWHYVAVPLRGSEMHPRQKRQVKPRLQETSLWPSDVRIVFSVISIIRTELVNSTEALLS